MPITKCNKPCIFVNMIGYCCLDESVYKKYCLSGQRIKAKEHKAV
jgi:hypothetical protein